MTPNPRRAPRPPSKYQALIGPREDGFEQLSDDRPPPHHCRRPGVLRRLLAGAKLGAIWRCGTCGRRWKLVAGVRMDYWQAIPWVPYEKPEPWL